MKHNPPVLKLITVGYFFVLCFAGAGCGGKNGRSNNPVTQSLFDSTFRKLAKAGKRDTAVWMAFGHSPAKRNAQSIHSFSNSMYACADTLFHWKMGDSGLLLLKKIIQYHAELSADSSGAVILFKALKLFDQKFNPNILNPEAITFLEMIPGLIQKYPSLRQSLDEWVYNSLAVQFNVAGDLKKSSSYYYRFYQEGMRRKPVRLKTVSGAIANYGIALNESGLPDSALHLSQMVVDSPGLTGARRINLLVNMAESWRLKTNYALAKYYSSRAADSLKSITVNRQQPVYSVLFTQAKIEEDVGNAEAAGRIRRSLLDSQLYYQDYRSRYTGKLLLETGRSFLKKVNADSALWYYHQALYTVSQTDSANINSLPALRDIYAENTLMDALDGMANAWDEIFTTTGNHSFLEKALYSRQLAFETERKLLETFTYDDAMTGLLKESKRRSKKALMNCNALFKVTQNAQWVEQALQVAEKSKSVVLLHSVKRNRAAMNNNDAGGLFTKLQQLRYQEIAIVKELNAKPAGTARDELLVRQQSISQQYLEMESKLNRQHPELKRSGIDSNLLTLKNIYARLLPPGSCLLEFFEADSLTFVIWLGANGRSGIHVPDKGAQEYTRKYAASLQTPDAFLNDSTAFYRTALQCTGLLLPPELIQDLQSGACSHIIAIPDGRVSLLPLEALVLPATGGYNRYLIEYAAVNTGYSVSTLLANLYGREPKQHGPLTIFTPFSKTNSQGMPKLPFTNREAQAVQQQFKNSVRYDDVQATKTAFWKSIASSGIIHLASHARAMDSVTPGIYLYDSVISMPELYAAATQARLVVLSACQTGVGDIDPNEGPLSLSRAFYYAGARNVINSLWQVQDDATASIFDYFYKDFPAANAATALRNAKLKYLQSEDISRRGPYYWAGLVHAGYEATTMNTTNNKKWWRWTALIAALAAIGGLLYYRRRRNR